MFSYFFRVSRVVLKHNFLSIVPFFNNYVTKNSKMSTLADFGYFFDKGGQLKNLDGSGEGFVFNVYEQHTENQKRYEKLGEVVNDHIYKLLEDVTLLKRIQVPISSGILSKLSNKGKGFIFASEGYENEEKLMLIIHGSGVVRAGQWSRKLIINNSLKEGSQIPYIHKAKELGYGVLVLNSNQNHDEHNGKKISGSESPEDHMHYVWEEIVRPCKAKYIAIVAHSYGGVITVNEASTNEDMRARVFAVAFTDSVHGYMRQRNKNLVKWLERYAVNWVSSNKDLDTPLNSNDCLRVSAGTPVHEETSYKAFDSVWKFIEERLYEQLTTNSPSQPKDDMKTNVDKKETTQSNDSSDDVIIQDKNTSNVEEQNKLVTNINTEPNSGQNEKPIDQTENSSMKEPTKDNDNNMDIASHLKVDSVETAEEVMSQDVDAMSQDVSEDSEQEEEEDTSVKPIDIDGGDTRQNKRKISGKITDYFTASSHDNQSTKPKSEL